MRISDWSSDVCSSDLVLVTVVGKTEADPSKGFFPLTVDYIEKTYAAGKIPGGFLKREGRPSEKETLTCRLIDRPIRPLFPDRKSDVQGKSVAVRVDPGGGRLINNKKQVRRINQ